jgi:hypothetical protein
MSHIWYGIAHLSGRHVAGSRGPGQRANRDLGRRAGSVVAARPRMHPREERHARLLDTRRRGGRRRSSSRRRHAYESEVRSPGPGPGPTNFMTWIHISLVCYFPACVRFHNLRLGTYACCSPFQAPWPSVRPAARLGLKRNPPDRGPDVQLRHPAGRP